MKETFADCNALRNIATVTRLLCTTAAVLAAEQYRRIVIDVSEEGAHGLEDLGKEKRWRPFSVGAFT